LSPCPSFENVVPMNSTTTTTTENGTKDKTSRLLDLAVLAQLPASSQIVRTF
jgi:hypothetical protein